MSLKIFFTVGGLNKDKRMLKMTTSSVTVVKSGVNVSDTEAMVCLLILLLFCSYIKWTKKNRMALLHLKS